jgi:quinoprotein glucose dehydrogenase
LVDAVLQATKPGFLFVLDRLSGRPLHPVEERRVPASDVGEERAWPTQPMPVRPPPLVPQHLNAEDAWGPTQADRDACRARIASLRSEGLFTPPSRQGTVVFPSLIGGANWGGAAVHAERGIAVINMSNLATVVQLVDRAEYDAARPGPSSAGVWPQLGAPYGVRQALLRSTSGAPCNPPPWGILAGVDVAAGEIRWRVPLGNIDRLMLPGGTPSGTANLGGPIITAGSIVFIAATSDNYLRAFDLETGRELWRVRLPAGGQATPMTYEAGGRQFLVIAAGGHTLLGTSHGDQVIAFALPR